MKLPQFNFVPKSIQTSSDSTIFSQINILQDHRNNFYDTSIFLKKILKKELLYLLNLRQNQFKKKVIIKKVYL